MLSYQLITKLSELLSYRQLHRWCCIDGVAFVSLTLPEINEMVPPIGLAKKIVKLIPKVYVH